MQTKLLSPPGYNLKSLQFLWGLQCECTNSKHVAMVGVAGWYKVPFIGLNWPKFCTPGTDILTCTFTVGEDSGAVLFEHMKDRGFSNVVYLYFSELHTCL